MHSDTNTTLDDAAHDWEMTPWAYRAAELVLRECWRVGFGFVSCVLL